MNQGDAKIFDPNNCHILRWGDWELDPEDVKYVESSGQLGEMLSNNRIDSD